jgi:hypothetical protein
MSGGRVFSRRGIESNEISLSSQEIYLFVNEINTICTIPESI